MIRISISMFAIQSGDIFTKQRYAIVVRNSTKKRVHRKMKKAQNELENGVITQAKFDGMVASYLGIVSHARDRKTTKYLKGFLA